MYDGDEFLRWAMRSPYRHALKRALRGYQKAWQAREAKTDWNADYEQTLDRYRRALMMLKFQFSMHGPRDEKFVAYWRDEAHRHIAYAGRLRMTHGLMKLPR